MKKTKILLLLLLLILSLSFNLFLLINLYPLNYSNLNLFMLELVNVSFKPNYLFLYLFNSCNLILIYLISKDLFKGNYVYIPSLIYAITPWVGYLIIYQSVYIILLFIVLLGIYGFIRIKRGINSFGYFIFISSLVLGIYCSFYFLFMAPLVLILLLVTGEIKIGFRQLILLILITLPLIFVILNNRVGFKNIYSNEVKYFSDPGMVATVNKFQGEARIENLYWMSRFSENKYLIVSESVLIKIMKSVYVSTYFTPEEKILGFSFIPPLFIGFMLPFIYGLSKLIVKLKNKIIYLIIPFFFFLPSVFSSVKIDLVSLILVLPFIIFVIAWGMYEMIIVFKKKQMVKLFLILTFVLLFFQMFVGIIDIYSNERARYLKVANESHQTF